MARLGMLIDLNRCVGCHGCSVACQAEWELLPEQHFTRVHRYEVGSFPKVRGGVVLTQCMHCDDPPCSKVCPTGATQKRPDGLVIVDEKKCIGCRYCESACPYGARSFNRERSIVQKCYFCYHRTDKGKKPACVETCMAGARFFGDLEDPGSEINKLIRARKAIRIAGTGLAYVPPRNWPMDRSLLPPDFKEPGTVRVWQDLVRPAGKAAMGLAAAAVVTSLLINTFNKGGGHRAGKED
ncbi:Fe-S-cluster-containing dehydrogenase component [Thermanaeromonas toyohensis ToBE]|uniref:Fe-S-cluster-containing dehydrogenase component n=1 Tax=Thermanaeromonas toyohensis ToBE TaxID=698762 RepID=A0A1W1VJS4_9FIRM|nr:4Fe-4S dicluster domain-containing protein [Thermanaeromonas toyohensis]SMB93533.1 Fe-S-cluster-containing dehydrogenase component [Thermanaeromonas toyohensis ToBE]